MAILFPILILIILHINSTTWFRIRLADYYKNNRQYIKAIQIYNKILRKDSLKGNLSNKIFTRINFDLGYLYSRLDLRNLAIESYARGTAKFPDTVIDNYYFGDDLNKDKLLVIGLLEAGRWNKAIKGFRKLKQLYSQFQDVEKYINTAIILNGQNPTPDDKNFFFLIGNAYIQNQLFDEASAFFTKRILDYRIHPLDVLNYLHKIYSSNTEIKQKVWGDNIYVTLEDFETINPRLTRWVNTAEAETNNHYITKEVVYEGNYSEFLDITYTKNGYDYWVRATEIPLHNTNLNLGICLFTKSIEPPGHILKFNAIYPKQGESGVYLSSDRQDIGSGWEEYRIENLFERAKGIASRPGYNWDTEGMLIDKIILDTRGVSNKIYIDSIKLYLVN